MHWKKHLTGRDQGSDQPEGIFSVLKKKIPRVRRENEPPVRDPESFSRYVCDLCHVSGPLSGLRQCVICGRWGCSNCWIDEYYLCRSCSGIMHLLLIKEHHPTGTDDPADQQDGII